MTTIKGSYVAISFLLRRLARKRRGRKALHQWSQRHDLLHADLDKQDRVDWIAMFIVTILNVAMWGWYFYYAYKAAPYVWPAR